MGVTGGLLDRPIAHRGLWRPGAIAENTLAGFAAARDAGYSIELDVRLSKDGEAVLIHDPDLRRMAGVEGLVCERTAAELAALPLKDPGHIPTLAQALTVIGPGIPVLIELKTLPGGEGPLERRVVEVAAEYGDLYAYIGFDAYAVALMAQLDPETPRGMSALDFQSQPLLAPDGHHQAWTDLEQVSIARPQFMVLDKAILDRAPSRRLRAEGLPVAAWTIRTPAQQQAALADCDQVIFEHYLP